MTHEELKALIESGNYCIECPSDWKTNEMWEAYTMLMSYHVRVYVPGVDYSLSGAKCWPSIPLTDWYDIVVGGMINKKIAEEASKPSPTIENLRNRLVAMDNRDGALTLEQMQELVKYVWPEDDDSLIRSGFPIINAISECNSKWIDRQQTDLPTYPSTIFWEEYQATKQPEQWQPKRGEMVRCSTAPFTGQMGIIGRFIGMDGNLFIINAEHNNLYYGLEYCSPIPKHQVTEQELLNFYAESKGLSVEQIEKI